MDDGSQKDHVLQDVAPYGGFSQQVQRVRFYLLNANASPCKHIS